MLSTHGRRSSICPSAALPTHNHQSRPLVRISDNTGQFAIPYVCLRPTSSSSLNPYCLSIGKLADAVRPQFPAVPGLLHPTKGEPRIGSHHFVDEHHSSFEFVDEAVTFSLVIRPGTRTQPKSGVVCDSDGVIDVFRPKNAGYWTEQLFTICRRVSGNIR